MAVRVSHTNNSQGHDGTYVYRSASPMDPQNLPAPIADAPPATGATFEYIDNESLPDGTYYYRTQDHEGGQVSVASEEEIISFSPDYAGAQVGDEIGGGIYAGTITYADNRQFHVISAKESGEEFNLRWKTSRTATAGTTDEDDGQANTSAMSDAGLSEHPAASYCLSYAGGGHSDWYMPSRNEVTLLYNNLAGHIEFSANVASQQYTWASTEYSDSGAWTRQFKDGSEFSSNFKDNSLIVRPIRRVPV